MHTTNIYNANGELCNNIYLNDDVQFCGGRVWKGSKHYYKGIGCPYQGHYLKPNTVIDHNKYYLINHSDVFYMGPFVTNKRFIGKTGIFQEQYQPQFEDFIGSCGVKELAIIENSLEFEKSSVDILKGICYDKSNSQYYFMLNYKCNRISFLDRGNNRKLYDLLDYMISENWNFIWDKNSISDVSYNGLVTDVADIFKSSELKHKLGTVYSILYSLHHNNRSKFMDFIKLAGLRHVHHMDFVLNSIKLINRFGCNTDILNIGNNEDVYINAVKHYLIEGKNCGDCSFVGLGDQIRETYRKNTLELA